MKVFAERLLWAAFIAALGPPHAAAQGGPLRLRWGLSDEHAFFREILAENSSSPRVFQLDAEKSKQEGALQCKKEVKSGAAISDFCEGLAARIAPVLDFAFDSDKAGTYVLDRIEVECLRVFRYRGAGFSKESAHYDLPLPTQRGTKSFPPLKPLVFTSTGTIQLRCWPDMKEDDGVALDLNFHFIFRSEGQDFPVNTGKFTLKF
jgi:hypothetical protein